MTKFIKPTQRILSDGSRANFSSMPNMNPNKRILIFEDHFNSVKGEIADNLEYLVYGLHHSGVDIGSVSLEFSREMKSAADIAKFFSKEQNSIYEHLTKENAVEKILDFCNKKYGTNIVGNSYENLSKAVSHLDYDDRSEVTKKLFPQLSETSSQRFALFLGRIDGTPGLVKIAKATEAVGKKCRFIDLTNEEKEAISSSPFDRILMSKRDSYMALQMTLNPGLGFFGLGHYDGLTSGIQFLERTLKNDPNFLSSQEGAIFKKVLPVSSNTVCLYPFRGKSIDPSCDELKQQTTLDRINPFRLRAIDVSGLGGKAIADKLIERVVDHEKNFNQSKGSGAVR